MGAKETGIRCDGAQPCGQCQWYQQPELCAYSKPTQRIVPSRKLVERLQSQADQYHTVVSRLFPGQELEALLALPRDELVNLALTTRAPTTSPSNGSEPTTSIARDNETLKSEDAEGLDALEQAPEQNLETDEAKRHRDRVQSISDDVNGLSLSVDRQSSYVGVSSITAALKVIFHTAPITRPFIAQRYTETALPSRSTTPPLRIRDPDPFYLPPPDIGHKLIDSYFKHVHCMMPMIDEDQFWHTYLYGERRDGPWLSLLNIVMALGSMSMSTCDDEDHIIYFKRSRKHLDTETFGSGSLLVLQALGLMSGYYLHWLNRPNEANSLMGATLRMATALGLHREYGPVQPSAVLQATTLVHSEVPVEIRRRTWWSLFCLDTWANLTTGRPALGRMGPGITVHSPRIPEQMNNAQYLASLRLLPLIHNIEFCKIATKVQNVFAARPLLRFEELFSLDAELVKWHNELPPLLRDISERPASIQRTEANVEVATPATASHLHNFDFSQPPSRDHTACPEVLKTPRAVMHWRYQNLRMLMHRPLLLAAALRESPHASMSAEEKFAVDRCRTLAGQTISDIVATCEEELIAGWNAVWLMYQAVMVPLVSLFVQPSFQPTSATDSAAGHTPESVPGRDEELAKWRQQVETAMDFFDKMRRFSVAAKKSKDVVERLYEASKHVRAYHEHQAQQQDPHASRDGPARESVFAGARDVSSAAGPFSPTVMTSFNAQDPGQGDVFAWGLSPNRDAAMNVFWDDMMWETFPELPEQPGWVPGLDQFEFAPPLQPNENGGADGNQWSEWMNGGQRR